MVQKRRELARPIRAAQLFECLRLDLPDASQVAPKLRSDLYESVIGRVADAETS